MGGHIITNSSLINMNSCLVNVSLCHDLSWKGTSLKSYQLHILYVFRSSKSDIWCFSVVCKEVEEQMSSGCIWMKKELNGRRKVDILKGQ